MERKFFKEKKEILPLPDLTLTQKESFDRFLSEGIQEVLDEINPIQDYTGRGWEITFASPRFGKPKISQEEAMEKGLAYSFPWYLTATLADVKSGKKIPQEVYMGEIPQMTGGGTFIINGVERVVVNQLLRSEGVYFTVETDPVTGVPLSSARILPKNGAWLEFTTARKNYLTVRISNYRKMAATTLLRAFGLASDEEIKKTFADVDTDSNRPFIEETLKKDPAKSYEAAILEVFSKVRPGEPALFDTAKLTFERIFTDHRRYDLGRAGRFKLNQVLDLNLPINERKYRLLMLEDLVATIRRVIELNHGIGEATDIDHLGNRRIRSVGELIQAQLRIGFIQMERVIKERMSLQAREQLPKPTVLISTRPIEARLHSFFASSQLSQCHEQTNPLAGLEHLRRLSVKGPGGLTTERASFSVRDAHFTHYGRVCPIKTPEGASIGLTTHLALYARVNELGFLETPYRKIDKSGKNPLVTKEIVYLTAYDEDQYVITDASVRLGDDGRILDERIPLRHRGEFFFGSADQADLMDVTPRQIVSASAALIPFLAHDDINRALMASNMENQAVPLLTPEAPLVGTGIEKELAKNSGVVITAEDDGKITSVDSEQIEVMYGKKKKVYHLQKFVKSNDETCYNQRVRIAVGQKVKKGDLLADGPSIENGELALGRNLTIAYMSWEGLSYEDALVISERLQREDLLSSIHITEHVIRVLETKLGPEEVTRDIPNVSETALRNLDENGIVTIGAEVKGGDILVGKIASKGETELSAEERLLRAIFGEKAREVRDVSLRMSHGEWGTVVDVKILDRKETELPVGVLEEIAVRVAQVRKITVGDKLAGRHGNKGVISKIVSVEDMPHLEDGTPVDIILEPRSVVKRMNLGQILEAHLGWAAEKLQVKYAVPAFEKFEEQTLIEELRKAGLPVTGKTKLYDGRTGKLFDHEVVVGKAYFLKLEHLAEDKIHARSTGPYALITQQPLGGKAQFGGQRFGEMEVWALEAYGAAYTLQEMLTIKSDDLVGRSQTYRAIIQGEEVPAPTVPESFKLLVKEINGVGLSVETLSSKGELASTSEEGGLKPESHKEIGSIRDFNALQISIASPEVIKGWSYGEVTKPETINYRTFKAEKDGLFDERIFGPTKDYECYCGKYKKARFKGIICDKCGVEDTNKRARRERMGHITLAAPAAHVWFFRGVPSIIGILLGISPRNLEGIVYFTRYLVTDVDREKKKEAITKFEADINQQLKELGQKKEEDEKQREKEKTVLKDKLSQGMELLKSTKRFSLLTEAEYELIAPYLKEFAEVGMGAEVLRRTLATLDLEKMVADLRKKVREAKGEGRIRFARRLRVIENLYNAGIAPSWMILTLLPVIPPDLRPMVQLEGGRFATSDLNDLYRAVLNRNNRLKRLLELGAPEIIIRNEKRMLQEAVDALIDSSKTRRGKISRGKKQLRSFADMLSGKQGRFRQNLLGKRVDYSGRSVIVVGPKLKITQAGIPREMALELFKPFVLREILLDGLAPNLRSAKTYLEERGEGLWDILERVAKDHPVLLNRAPSLHRLSILGFYPKLIGGSAIQLHPAVCAGFNADFDGDAMAVHLPLSNQAIEEVKTLILSSRNLLRPATGEPIAYPNKEQVMGLFYLTLISADEQKRGEDELKIFPSATEALLVYELGGIKLRERIKVMISAKGGSASGGEGKLLITTVGRILFNQKLPEFLCFINEPIDASKVKAMVAQTLNERGEEEAARLIDALKDLGFAYASDSNISLAVFDAIIPAEKPAILKEAEAKTEEIERNFRRGLITDFERKELARVVWSEATSKLAELAWLELSEENPIKFMITSGAAGATKEQVKQISGMRGHIVDPLGRIVEMPIRSNYHEGLTGFEYFAGARGARKGLVDTALRTASAGYLTRRLVDVAQDMIIREEDCGTKDGIPMLKSEETLLATFANRLVGRIVVEDVKVGRKVLVKKGEMISREQAKMIEEAGIEEVLVRSPLTCESLNGICAACYGLDLGRNRMVEMGTPVGIIAAQSIGEPGTQLTLRTFHTGGIVGKDITQGLPRVEEVFEARTPKFEAVVAEFDGKVSITEEEERQKITLVGGGKTANYDVPVERGILVSNGEAVKIGQPLTEGFLDPKKLLKLRGIQATQKYLVNEARQVYSSQGVSVDDIHLEVITRQMFNKVRVKSPGGTTFIPGEIITKTKFFEENEKVGKAGGAKAAAEVVILGITKSSLKTDSFLSAASFQETTRILTEAAASGSVDRLLGLKENVIIGRLIPTGERARLDRSQESGARSKNTPD